MVNEEVVKKGRESSFSISLSLACWSLAPDLGLLGHLVRHGGSNEAWSDRVDRDASVRILFAKRPRQADQACLRRGIVRLTRIAPDTHYGGNVDDTSKSTKRKNKEKRKNENDGGGLCVHTPPCDDSNHGVRLGYTMCPCRVVVGLSRHSRRERTLRGRRQPSTPEERPELYWSASHKNRRHKQRTERSSRRS